LEPNHARARENDDDDLLRKLKEAANGNVAPTCRNVGPIRKLLAEGIPLEVVLACFRNNVAHLRQPLQTFGADFIAIEARAHVEAIAAAEARGDVAKAIAPHLSRSAFKRALIELERYGFPEDRSAVQGPLRAGGARLAGRAGRSRQQWTASPRRTGDMGGWGSEARLRD
jgi:hypothetical protein